ncbi:hypothetical protein V8C86DRAFT_2437538 [Haematococcus lacustris]
MGLGVVQGAGASHEELQLLPQALASKAAAGLNLTARSVSHSSRFSMASLSPDPYPVQAIDVMPMDLPIPSPLPLRTLSSTGTSATAAGFQPPPPSTRVQMLASPIPPATEPAAGHRPPPSQTELPVAASHTWRLMHGRAAEAVGQQGLCRGGLSCDGGGQQAARGAGRLEEQGGCGSPEQATGGSSAAQGRPASRPLPSSMDFWSNPSGRAGENSCWVWQQRKQLQLSASREADLSHGGMFHVIMFASAFS